MDPDITEMVDSFRELINQIKDKAMYNKNIDLNSENAMSLEFYEGVQSSYFHVMEAIITHIEIDENLTLKEFGLEDYQLTDILNAVPKNKS